jgi:hypothetical protein
MGQYMKTLMTAAVTLAVVGLTGTGASAQYNCHHDPVCQAKRDGVTVQQARQKDNKIAQCARRVGVSADAWSRYAVPAGPKADGMRACVGS